jgi:ABC-type phosphate transport system substrate-binding protein
MCGRPVGFAGSNSPFDILFTRWTLSERERRFLQHKGVTLRRIHIGQRRLVVLVSEDSRTKSISYENLKNMLFAKGSSKEKNIIIENSKIVKELLVATIPLHEDPLVNFASPRKYSDQVQWLDRNTLLQTVARSGDTIGIILQDISCQEDMQQVQPIAIKVGDQLCMPANEPIMQSDYPLTEQLYLYEREVAGSAMSPFLLFCVGSGGTSVMARYGGITPYREQEYRGEQRFTALRSGRGDRISLAGERGDKSKDILNDLSVEYVRAKEVVQLGYTSAGSDIVAVGQFVAGARVASESPATAGDSGTAEDSNATGGNAKRPSRELLVLGDRPSEKAMEIHGEKWNALGRDENGQPDGTGPAEHLLAGRAVAIIVNPANKLESLTLPQLQAIFGGEVKEWSIIGGTGLEPGERVGGKTLPINLYGLRANDDATAVFEKECLPRDKWRGVQYKKTTAEAVKAVSMDPNAMAFVDLAAIPGLSLKSLTDGFAAGGQNVKVLAIQVGVGERAEVVKPSPSNIANAMYPLAQRVYLYVHPDASDSAKGFAEFIATCGGSEATPYADTVKAVMDTYQKHGLIPLADAAIERMTKDAMSAAKAQAASDDKDKAK